MGVYLWVPHDDYSAMQWPAPSGFHIPLTTEWKAVYDIWTALGGGSSDWTNFGIALKLPFAGYRSNSSAGVDFQGAEGDYWSSSRYNASNAYYLYFNSTALTPQSYNRRANGFSVRCFKNSPTVPTSSWTKLYWTSIEAWWIFWSSTDWLISLSSNWNTWITIQDKNLWATTVWNSGDTLSETNAWKYYQRWNNYGFPRTWSVTTSGTRVDASNYWPLNYYSSSTFITYNWRWDTTNNWNLWWWVTWVVLVPTTELKNAYIGEYNIPMSWLLGYRPLQSDLKDASWNGKDWSWYSWTGSFSAVWGKTGARVTENSSRLATQFINTSLSYNSSTITACWWIYLNSVWRWSWVKDWDWLIWNMTNSTWILIWVKSPEWYSDSYAMYWTQWRGVTRETVVNTWSWYFLAITANWTAIKWYKNGVLSESYTSSASTHTSTLNWRIWAAMPNGSSYQWTDWWVRHCAVYNRALTADEIMKFYTLTA